MNGVASNMGEINCRVPQGSCLGPLLFLIYINDLPFSLKNSEVTMYDDDTSISYSSKNIDELNETLNSDLDSLKQWLESNKLSLNVIKTQAMVVGSRPNLKRISDKLVPIEELKWPIVHDMIKQETATIGFKSTSGLTPTYLSTLFTRSSTRDIVNLRNCETDVLAPRMKTSNGHKAFSFRGAKVWNELKYEVKLAPLCLLLNVD